jgi:hypothetical protein
MVLARYVALPLKLLMMLLLQQKWFLRHLSRPRANA